MAPRQREYVDPPRSPERESRAPEMGTDRPALILPLGITGAVELATVGEKSLLSISFLFVGVKKGRCATEEKERVGRSAIDPGSRREQLVPSGRDFEVPSILALEPERRSVDVWLFIHWPTIVASTRWLTHTLRLAVA